MTRLFLSAVGSARVRRYAALALSASLLFLLPMQPVWAAKRVALIIGNAQYQNEKLLKNPVNDAHALARTLKEDLQFDDVIERSNVTRRELGRLIDQLGQRAQGADAVVVYYSGHGMQGAGGNYLIPVDAQITSTEDVKLEGVPANDVVDVLNQSGARVALLILDACRDNPFRTRTKGGSKGLARMNVSGGNLLVAYATQEGDTADDGTGNNSPYAQALIQNLKRKDLRVLEVFDEVAQQVKASTAQKQRPTRYGDLPVNVYLTGAPTQLASLQPVPVRPVPNGPTGGAANFGDLERAQKEEAAARQKWAAWQARMKADFNKAAGFSGSAELEAKAWERFLAAYAEDNPYSDEDDKLRAEAGRKQGAAQARAQARAQEATRPTQAQTAAGASAGAVFKDCDACPEMVVLPTGRFSMGSPDSEAQRGNDEGPQHEVTINYRLAVGKYAVTFDEWQACVNGGGCASKPNPSDKGWGRGRRPVINLSWNDAQEYVQWLKGKTGKAYRLLSEAEWEYAARARTTKPFYTGRCINTSQANYDGSYDYNSCGAKTGTYLKQTQPVGSYAPNAFGLYDMAGNVWQWVGDVYHDNYNGAPTDGTAWVSGGDSSRRVLRGGSWFNYPNFLRSAGRSRYDATDSSDSFGFRVARTY